jgi:PAS domain S-box-containing protein
MRNMKTAASLTIGLANGPHLWGMLVCHHTVPRIAGPELRAIADMIGQVVSLLIGSLSAAERYAQQLERNVTLRHLIDRLASPGTLTDTIAAMETELLRLVDASGAVVRLGGTVASIGSTPARSAAERALEILHPGPDGEPVGVDDLGLRYPSLVECTQAGSGALILPLGQGAGDAILWFRPEQARSITWGGNPTEHGTTDPVTGELCPRVSFAAWKEIVRGRSAPWTDADLSLARAFQRAFEVEVARRTKVALDLFDRAFESSPVAMVLTGRDGLIKILNRQVERMFGFGRAELEGARFDRLMPQRFRSEYAVATLRVLTDMSPCTLGNALDMFGLHKDGSEFPLELTLSPIDPIDFAGEPMMQASIENLTLQRVIEREKIEAERDKEQKRHELEQSNADLEEFAYAISHDLKAPLRAIGHLAGWIEEDIAGAAKPETRENMKLLQGRVVRMQKLLDGLLEYSCLRHTDKSIEDVDIADVVRDVVAMLEVPPGFVVAYEGDASVIRTERVAIQLVLDNLISNALRHHDRTSGRVDVAMQRVDGVAEIRVKDDGPGIAAQFHRRIFTIFQTLKSRDTLESSGIGLAIVKRKVEIHGGQIWVESAPPARGSTFVFTWNETAK